jgi:hypothetical protein
MRCLTLNLIEQNTHKRKWGLTIKGIPGVAGENDYDTRISVCRWAKETLCVTLLPPDPNRLVACHRLKQQRNAPILIVFMDLSERNNWLACAKNLKNSNQTITPDLPPEIRPLYNDIMMQRRDLPPEEKRIAIIKYIPSWPFLKLLVNGTTHIPRLTQDEIVQGYLDKYCDSANTVNATI